MVTKKIVITGGPATGKTSLIQKLEKDGHYCLNEYIRDVTKDALTTGQKEILNGNPIASVDNPYDFNLQLLNGRIKQYEEASAVHSKTIAFFDRGIPDVLAYMEYFKQPQNEIFKKACFDHKYDQVFILPPWKEIYTTDSERYESFEQASAIYHNLLKTYTDYGYQTIEVPEASVLERVNFILKNC